MGRLFEQGARYTLAMRRPLLLMTRLTNLLSRENKRERHQEGGVGGKACAWSNSGSYVNTIRSYHIIRHGFASRVCFSLSVLTCNRRKRYSYEYDGAGCAVYIYIPAEDGGLGRLTGSARETTLSTVRVRLRTIVLTIVHNQYEVQ